MSYIEEFCEFLSIPSVSALSEHKDHMLSAAKWLKERMEKAGMEDVQIIPTEGHPVVYGQARATNENAPTVLIYGHYDTQPPDPLSEWHSDPFKPEIRDGKIFARGAADDKGGVFPAIVATEEAIKSGRLPCNLKFLFEGEEEIGSPSIKPVLTEKKELFSSQLVISVDGGMYSKDLPSLTVGCRGLAAIQIDVFGPRQDVHSGGHGGAIQNPIQALSQILSSMKDEEGRILVEGFYDSVVPLSKEEREEVSQVPFDEEAYKEGVGVPELFGEPEYSLLERMWARPTLDANGVFGGFQGEGVKTIIPGKASCKITCRLVPNQEPAEICRLLEEHVRKHTPKGVRANVTVFPGNSRPYAIPKGHPALCAVSKVLEKLYERKPVTVRLGGTLPIARSFLDILGTYLVFFAMSSPDENAHGPNEFIRVDEFHRLRKGLPMLWEELASSLK